MRTTLAFSGINEADIEEDFSPDPPNPEETFDVQLVIDDLKRFTAGCDRFYSLSTAISRLRSHYARTHVPHYMRRRLQAAVVKAERAAPVVLPGFNPTIIENGFRALFVLASLWGDEKDESGPRSRLPWNPSDPTGAFRAAADGWARILQNSAHSMSLAYDIGKDGAWDSVAWLPASERV